MANIIDSLSIELGLDISKFKKSQQDVIAGLKEIEKTNDDVSKSEIDNAKKVTEAEKEATTEKQKAADSEKKAATESAKHAHQTQLDNKKTLEGYEKSRNALVSFAAATFSLAALASVTKEVAASNAALGRSAKLLDMSPSDLQAWGGVAKGFGGDLNTIPNALQNIKEGIAKFSLGMGGEQVRMALGFLKIEDKDSANIFKISSALRDFQKTHNILEAKSITEMLGFDESGFNILLTSPEKLQDLIDKYKSINHITPELTANSDMFVKKVSDLIQALTGVKNEAANGSLPVINAMITSVTDITAKFADFDKETDHVTTRVIALVAATTALLNVIKALKFIGVPAAFKLLSNPVVAGAMATFYSKGLNQGEDEALVESRKEAGLVDNGTVGLSKDSYKRNNPGNIKYGEWAKKAGAIGQEHGFAVFPDTATGAKALDDLLLNNYKNGKFNQDTIASIISGVGSSHEHAYTATVKDQPNYIKFLSQKLGIDPNAHLSNEQLHNMAGYIPTFEGTMIGSGVNTPTSTNNNSSSAVHTNINSMTINTQATDANGIMQSAQTALQQNSLMNNGMRTMN